MERINLYSSAPLTTQLAVAFQNLKAGGLQVELRPLSALPVRPGPGRPAALRQELLAVYQRLATIGEALSAHEAGELRLGAGDEQGLLAERDALHSRRRGIEAALVAQEGGPNGG